MASHSTIPPDSSDIGFHAWPARLSASPSPPHIFSASNIKNILVVSRHLLAPHHQHQPANTSTVPPSPIFAPQLLHPQLLPALSSFLPPGVLPPPPYSLTHTPVPSPCDATSSINPASLPPLFLPRSPPVSVFVVLPGVMVS